MDADEKRVIPVDIADYVVSTNSFIKERCKDLPPRYTLRARVQTGGRGRFDRIWQSKPDEDLTFSTLVPADSSILPYLIHVPQIAALALHDVLQETGVAVSIKWPNDILTSAGKKIAGILVEGVFQGDSQYLIAGIGLNLNSTEHESVAVPHSSVFLETGKFHDPDQIMMLVNERFYDLLDQLGACGFAPFVSPLNELLAYRGEFRSVTVSGEKMNGVIRGVGSDGGLLLETDRGMVSLISGEISFRDA